MANAMTDLVGVFVNSRVDIRAVAYSRTVVRAAAVSGLAEAACIEPPYGVVEALGGADTDSANAVALAGSVKENR